MYSIKKKQQTTPVKEQNCGCRDRSTRLRCSPGWTPLPHRWNWQPHGGTPCSLLHSHSGIWEAESPGQSPARSWADSATTAWRGLWTAEFIPRRQEPPQGFKQPTHSDHWSSGHFPEQNPKFPSAGADLQLKNHRWTEHGWHRRASALPDRGSSHWAGRSPSTRRSPLSPNLRAPLPAVTQHRALHNSTDCAAAQHLGLFLLI